MALPKKVKLTHDINPIKTGNEYLKYGFDRIEELMHATNTKTKYLPRTILLEDIDQAVYDFVSQDKLKITIDGKTVPTIYLDNDRWGDFSKTWKLMDNDKNIPTPYITIRRTEKRIGTRLNNKYHVPQSKRFRYFQIPILDDGELIYLLFKAPEPTNVDMIYEVVLFTKYRVDVNKYDEHILKNFASRQEYLFIKGNPMPIVIDSITESNIIENIDGDRLFVSKYVLKAMAFIQDESDFEIVKTTRKPIFGYSSS